MIVGIEASTWSNPRGYGRYTRGLLRALLSRTTNHEFILFVDPWTKHHAPWPLPEGVRIESWPSKANEHRYQSGSRTPADILRMSRLLKRFNLDALFFPSVFSYVPVLQRTRVILGLHDVIAETYPHLVFPKFSNRLLWYAKTQLGIRQADWLVTVSDYARETICATFRIPRESVRVVGEAPADVFHPVADRERIREVLKEIGLLENTPFLIALGGLNPHKNLVRLLQAFGSLHVEGHLRGWHLVLVGPAASDAFTPGLAEVEMAVEGHSLGDVVHITGYLPDEEVACLLTAAEGLVMPSLMEGFGLGAVEAAACGTPVLATRNSPLPDLLAGAGLFFDPHDLDDLRDALLTFTKDPDLRASLAEKALPRARALTWDRAAAQFLTLLEEAANQP